MERNEILANFQACTGIEDITECIATLEQCDWNLNEAVSVAIASASPTGPPLGASEDLTTRTATAPLPSFGGATSQSVNTERMIHFEVRMNETIKHVSLDETATLSTFRDLASLELQIPRTEAVFDGWPNPGTENLPEEATLGSLDLPTNVSLTVRAAHNGATNSLFGLSENVSIGATADFEVPCSAFDQSGDLQKLGQTFILEITNKKTNAVYNLNCVGSKSFEELKFDVHTLTQIVPSKQIWEGLTSDPKRLTLDRTIASLNLNMPVHKCSVTMKDTPSQIDLTADDDMEVEDFEDASDTFNDDFMFLVDTPTTSALRPLMPDEATDEVGALGQFQSEFNSRYGQDSCTPSFFIDTLDAAIQQAFGGPARNRKLLAVYLHHDKSIQSNVFCSQLLCAPSVVEYMANHCVIWAWDVTSSFNQKRLLDMCSKVLGSGVAETVKKVPRDGFPMLVLAHGRGRTCEVNSIIQGNTTLDELMVKLIKAVEDADMQKQEDIRMEELSEARERIKREQEMAYEESLMKDIEKQKKIEEEKARVEEAEREADRREQEKNNKIEELTMSVPPEPAADCGLPVTKIRFRPPGGGEMITRTFLASEKLQVLLDYVGSLGYLQEKYRVLSSWPKREVSSLDVNVSLKDHKLFPQDTLMIEERQDD